MGIKTAFNDLKKLTRPYAEEDDEFEEEYEEAAVEAPTPAPAPARRGAFERNTSRSTGTGKVMNLATGSQLQVILVKPDKFENSAPEIADHLREKHTVVLNLESTNKDEARRLVDFLSGCAYALDGKIKKIAISTYIITPYNVDVVGELVEELENNGVTF